MTHAALLQSIERYCREQDIEETTFGRKAVNDGKLVSRLRDGRTITLETLGYITRQLALPGAHSAWGERQDAA